MKKDRQIILVWEREESLRRSTMRLNGVMVACVTPAVTGSGFVAATRTGRNATHATHDAARLFCESVYARSLS